MYVVLGASAASSYRARPPYNLKKPPYSLCGAFALIISKIAPKYTVLIPK